MADNPQNPAPKNHAAKQKIYVYGIIISLFLVFFLVNLDRWFLLKEVFRSFDNELSQRLNSIGVLSAELIENYNFKSLSDLTSDPLQLLLLESQLQKIKRQNKLEAIYIINPSLRIIADDQISSYFIRNRNYLQADSLAIQRAFNGRITTSHLHHIAGEYFKNGYAPLRNVNGQTSGILVTEASAGYFTTLKFYRNTFWISLLASIVLFILFSIFVLQSFRKLLKSEASLRQSERLAFLGKMAAVMAHEIRNPLGIIRGTADVLKNKYRQSGKEEIFDYIPAEVNRLNNLIANFLTYAREQKLNLKRLNLIEFISELIRQVSLSEPENTVYFETFFEDEAVSIQADKDALKQIFLNIFRNAIQASESETQIVIYEKTFKKKGRSWVEIAVVDHGSGIEGDPEKIFEPFYTTKSTGTGLGMPISKKIIEQHGGSIFVESEIGKGTTVKILLPMSNPANHKITKK